MYVHTYIHKYRSTALITFPVLVLFIVAAMMKHPTKVASGNTELVLAHSLKAQVIKAGKTALAVRAGA